MVWVLSRAEGDVEVFFIGADQRGGVRWSVFWSDAAKFADAGAAYACARTHPALRNSDQWRAVNITDRCEPTR